MLAARVEQLDFGGVGARGGKSRNSGKIFSPLVQGATNMEWYRQWATRRSASRDFLLASRDFLLMVQASQYLFAPDGTRKD
jgi:hypothetical protein